MSPMPMCGFIISARKQGSFVTNEEGEANCNTPSFVLIRRKEIKGSCACILRVDDGIKEAAIKPLLTFAHSNCLLSDTIHAH